MKRPPNLTAVPESERRPMTKAETELFFTLVISEPMQPVPANDLVPSLEQIFVGEFLDDLGLQVLLQRLKLTDQLYDPRTVAMASFLIDRPGFAVLWAYTLYERTRELERPYGFDDLVSDFPMGFPTSDGAAKIWDAQKGWAQDPKVPVDNLLDGGEAWKAPVESEG